MKPLGEQLKDVLEAIVAGYGYSPIDDRDKSEPILVRMTLGDYLSAVRINAKLCKPKTKKAGMLESGA